MINIIYIIIKDIDGCVLYPFFYVLNFMEVIIINNNQNYNQKPKNNQTDELINENIRFKEMLVIGNDGTKYGVMQRRDAFNLANELSLDLVIVSAEAKPPVAKLMDYKKFKFEQKKKQKEIKKNQKITVVKEVQLSPVIDKHDLETKANLARKFIQKDNKVKVTLRFKGRMIMHQDLGFKVMQEFADNLADVGQIESQIKLEGKQLFMTIGPKKEK